MHRRSGGVRGLHGLDLRRAPAVLYSDSAFLVSGWSRGREWCVGAGRAHADICVEFWNVAEEFGLEAITVVKVRGHATAAMVDSGEVAEMDKFGNDEADKAAKRGAKAHPSVQAAVQMQAASRAASHAACAWIGAGLEQAQAVGSLPLALTQADKASRPRKGGALHLDVVADEQWRQESKAAEICSRAHPTHALRRTGKYFFCATCGVHAAVKVVELANPCLRKLLPSRKHKLDRLLRGEDPRSGERLPGGACSVRASALPPVTTHVRR